MTTIVLPFKLQPDLAATMDIQIPALAWQTRGSGAWSRIYRLGDTAAEVTVTTHDHALRFDSSHRLDAVTRHQLTDELRWQFPRQVASLSLTAHPILTVMANHYGGVIAMRADPFQALVLTVLSQNRSGELVRRVYPDLEERCAGITPERIAALTESELAEIIRPAGPYKAPRLAATARRITDDGVHLFTKTVTQAPGEHALAYLTSFPGVAHKTAACVLVFAAQSDHTLPVDTHLFRVTRRLDLTRHNGVLTTATRQTTVSALLGYGQDLAAAHFLFLLLGRSTCTATAPRCDQCFLRQHCPCAAELAATAPAGREIAR